MVHFESADEQYGASICLQELAEDMLIWVVSYLEPPEILRVAQTCRRFSELSKLRIVWTNACTRYVIARGYPFPSIPIDEISTKELIHYTNHAYHLAQRWLSGISSPRTIQYIEHTAGTSVSEIRFVPGTEGRFLVTISKSVWSVMSIWDMEEEKCPGRRSSKVCEWSPRGAIFTGFAMNGDPKSQATMAISLQLYDQHFVKILSLDSEQESRSFSVTEIYSVDTTMKPKTLSGDLLALTDDILQTTIWNWRDGTYALLEHVVDDRSVIQSNDCIQVFFAYRSVLVARARSIHLFPFPILKPYDPNGVSLTLYKPIAQHSFGWVDGQSLTICPFLKNTMYGENDSNCEPLSVLVRGESDDPWASDIHNLELYTFHPNPAYASNAVDDGEINTSPYLFPPRLSSKVACLRGSLRCKQVTLGRFGTAMWIQPRDRFIGGLLADIPSYLIPASNAHEALVMTAFPGSLNVDDSPQAHNGETSVVIGKKIFGNESTNGWSSFDYDEVGGRIALGSSFGRVTILEL